MTYYNQTKGSHHVKEEKTRASLYGAILVGSMGILFGLQVWFSGELATVGHQITALEAEKETLLLENERLRNEYYQEVNLAELSTQAESAGFVKVAPGSIVHVGGLDEFAME